MEELFDGLLNDHLGFVVWAALAFVILLILLAKFAWKPIMGAISERERSIEDALLKAEAAKEEMARLTNENEQLLKQARAERDLILSEARKLKDQIVNEAKTQANVEGARMIEQARLEINSQKAIALADVKNQVAALSVEIAEKLLRKELADQKAQDEMVADLLREVKIS
ncbi:F0F1 ATP synthase subunit B [Mucilaginibacter sp. Bleaf8]|uniref:F0F1 ATP synthase subunit B n=1 Tax=Mucilaginibacter sp. Bleaf8 TaxID=2834430 RepID=UPI001BCE2EF4|nr:F0F1 ATP synthase subunit B [Mucilaginibacter sp. Bleaf8]MBS7564315.1 F0F1 ATP synthase subunit B [Mucilaginibacter sp. Bleaf8]